MTFRVALVPAGRAGTVTRTWVSEILAKDTFAVPSATAVTPVRPDPVISIVVGPSPRRW